MTKVQLEGLVDMALKVHLGPDYRDSHPDVRVDVESPKRGKVEVLVLLPWRLAEKEWMLKTHIENEIKEKCEPYEVFGVRYEYKVEEKYY